MFMLIWKDFSFEELLRINVNLMTIAIVTFNNVNNENIDPTITDCWLQMLVNAYYIYLYLELVLCTCFKIVCYYL